MPVTMKNLSHFYLTSIILCSINCCFFWYSQNNVHRKQNGSKYTQEMLRLCCFFPFLSQYLTKILVTILF